MKPALTTLKAAELAMASPADASEPFVAAAKVANSRFGLAEIARANATPLLNRLRQGEGALLAVNLSIALSERPGAARLVAQAVVSVVVLALLYLLNDVYDGRHDLADPGKDRAFASFCVRHRERLVRLLALEHAGAILLALALLGARSALAVAAVLLVNLAYSAFFKGRAAADVLWVALWGVCYAMVPGVPLPAPVLALVGAMTSICHVFQITRDRPADVANRVRTSAVAVAWLPTVQLAVACLAMALILLPLLGPAAAASAVVPLVLRFTMRSNQAAWLVSKVYYGAIWLMALGAAHAR